MTSQVLDEKERKVALMEKKLRPYEQKSQAIEEKLDMKRLALEEKEKQIRMMNDEMKMYKERLEEEEKAITAKVAALENDKAKITEKEREISRIYDKIEKEKSAEVKRQKDMDEKLAKLAKAEVEHSKRMADMNDAMAKLKAKERKIEEGLNDIKKVKELISMKKQLEETNSRLQKRVGTMFSKIEKKTPLPISIEHKEIKGKKMSLHRFEREAIAKLEGEIEVKHIPRTNAPLGVAKEIELVKELIRQRMFNDASLKISRLKEFQRSLKDAPHKKILYYDILELENDIKLARVRV